MNIEDRAERLEHMAMASWLEKQPQIDPTFVRLKQGVMACNHLVDLWGEVDSKSNDMTVEAIALAGTKVDMTDFYDADAMTNFQHLLSEDWEKVRSH